ncbi:hypothetical protein SASC598O02_015930 [Snodgrassella alvi SCGC AB-598-O02]|nr:hypothetical protein SASC598O02_015930 [Snodgrassella alvi SCGC AB-598-O02]
MTADLMLNIKFIKNNNTDVIIADEVLDIWRKYQQVDIKDNEACGILIGGYNEKQNKIFIDLCTELQKADLRKRTFFTLKDPFHQKRVNDVFISSQQTQFYLGTWHSHPENYPSPSNVDLQDWKKCIKRNSHNKFMVFAIIGLKEILINVYEIGKKQHDNTNKTTST